MRKLAGALVFGIVATLVVGCGGEATSKAKPGEAPPAPPKGPGNMQPKAPKAAD